LGEIEDQEEKMVKDRFLGNHRGIQVIGEVTHMFIHHFLHEIQTMWVASGK
jgi:hypothetical protein